MSNSVEHNWLVAYDIADEKRLVRLHRYIKKRAVAVQYSVFLMRATHPAMERIVSEMEELIEGARDDVRVYLLPSRIDVETRGRQPLPDEVHLSTEGISELINEGSAPVTRKRDGDEHHHEEGLNLVIS